MKFLLDTNAIIALMKGKPRLVARLRQYHPSDFAVPSVVLHELYYGACKSARVDENRRRVEELRFEILAFDHEDARSAGEIRAMLELSGQSIGAYDVLIAGQAVARELVLITRNMREFGLVENLRAENWED